MQFRIFKILTYYWIFKPLKLFELPHNSSNENKRRELYVPVIFQKGAKSVKWITQIVPSANTKGKLKLLNDTLYQGRLHFKVQRSRKNGMLVQKIVNLRSSDLRMPSTYRCRGHQMLFQPSYRGVNWHQSISATT